MGGECEAIWQSFPQLSNEICALEEYSRNVHILIVVQCSYNRYHRKCVYKPLIWGRVVQTSDFLPYKAACTAHRKENVP